MINIEDKRSKPNLQEIEGYIGNNLFGELSGLMSNKYQAIVSIEYSGDNVLLGWNVKFKKAGRTLCTVYPRIDRFHMLLIVGKKEKALVEALLPTFSQEFSDIYYATKEGMGQRWLLFEFSSHTQTFDDAMTVVSIRRWGTKYTLMP